MVASGKENDIRNAVVVSETRILKIVMKEGCVLNKRIKKKIEDRDYYPKYKDYKREVLKPWKDCNRKLKRASKLGGVSISKQEANDFLELGLYTEKEIRQKFNVIDNRKECLS